MSKRFDGAVKLNRKFVVGKLVIVDELGKKTCLDMCKGRSSDVGEKTIEWVNCFANGDDGEKQLVG